MIVFKMNTSVHESVADLEGGATAPPPQQKIYIYNLIDYVCFSLIFCIRMLKK